MRRFPLGRGFIPEVKRAPFLGETPSLVDIPDRIVKRDTPYRNVGAI